MALLGKSLDAVTTTGAGQSIEADVPKTSIGMVVTSTGSPTYAVSAEVSLDGVNWAQAFPSNQSEDGVLRTAEFGPFIYARANLTALSGGTSPTVTAVVGIA